MDEYLEWLIGKIEFEKDYVAHQVNRVLTGKGRFDEGSFRESAQRHQAFVEARAKYEELTGTKTSDE